MVYIRKMLWHKARRNVIVSSWICINKNLLEIRKHHMYSILQPEN